MKEKKIRTANKSNDENVLVMYLKEISRLPLLGKDEEDELTHAAIKGNSTARNKLVNGNLRFVVNMAKQYQGNGVPLIDLISEGNIGLVYAVEKYDPERNCRFISYAVWWIRHFILKALSEKSSLIRLPANCVRDINKMEIISLYKSIETNDEDLPLSDYIENNHINSPDQDLMNKSLEADIGELLATLDTMEADIIRCRYGLENQKPLSIMEISVRCGLSKERIQQIEQKALKRLQLSINKNRLEAYVA